MLQKVFYTILDMSMVAGYCALFVMFIRLIIKKLPKSYSYALWAIVFLRLVCPVMPESDWSLLPGEGLPPMEQQVEALVGGGTNTQGQTMMQEFVNMQNMTGMTQTAEAESAPVTMGSEYAPVTTVRRLQLAEVLSGVWFLVTIGLLAYGIASSVIFEKRLKGARETEAGIFEQEGLPTAFVTGLIKPRIYLPVDLPEEYRSYVLAHEKVHVKRGDNMIKHMAHLLTCMHWFNPLVWLSFYLMCKDMEMSCDEHVLRTLGLDEKKAYSTALLSIASGRKLQLGMPIAFSESDAKSRIKNVLNYRQPTVWIAGAAGVIMLVVAAGLLCNPSEEETTIPTEQETTMSTETSTPVEKETMAVSEKIWHIFLKEEVYAEDMERWIDDVLLGYRHVGWFHEYNGEKLQRISGGQVKDNVSYSPAANSDIIFYEADKEEELQTIAQTMISAMIVPLTKSSEERSFTISRYVLEDQQILPVSTGDVWLIKYIDDIYILMKENGVYRLQKAVDMQNYKTKELSLEDEPIYESDFKDLDILSDKLTEAMNLCFLFKEFEHINDIDVEWFCSMMFEFVDKDYTNSITNYFDENKLYESLARKVGQEQSAFMEAHQVESTGYGKIYNRPDGEAVLARIAVLHVERTDGANVEILYSCYWDDERSYYHYGDGKVTMREKDGEMIFVSNERVDLQEKPHRTEGVEENGDNIQTIQETSGEIAGIRITDGSNGNQIEVTEAENINELVTKVNK